MNDTLEGAPDLTEALLLDPFGAYPHWASGVPGLGGHEPPADPSYVFLTLDSRPAIGRVCVSVRFFDLAAARGTLLIEVRVRSAFPGAHPSRLRTISIDLAELTRSGGLVELEFESFRNTFYAIAGNINDETDVTASHISIAIDRRATAEQHGKAWGWRSPADGRNGARHSVNFNIEEAMVDRLLTDLSLPSLDEPTSQVGFPSQCREAGFAAAMETLQCSPAPSFENWSLAYVLRAIDRFACPVEGTSMLGFVEGDRTPLLSHFAARQCEIVGMRHVVEPERCNDPGAELQRLWMPELCDEGEFFAHAHFTTGDIRLPPTGFCDQFDIVWSIGANRIMTPGEFVNFAVHGLSSAKPGGFAFHVFDYVEDVGAKDTACLTRHDVERLAIQTLSHRNDVARLRFRHDATPAAGSVLPFGIVMRRGRTPMA